MDSDNKQQELTGGACPACGALYRTCINRIWTFHCGSEYRLNGDVVRACPKVQVGTLVAGSEVPPISVTTADGALLVKLRGVIIQCDAGTLGVDVDGRLVYLPRDGGKVMEIQMIQRGPVSVDWTKRGS